MAEVDLTKLTRLQKLDVCVAYLTEGNSVTDLCIQLIECWGGTDIKSGAVEEVFDNLVEEMKTVRKDNPGEFETTAEEEVVALLEIALENMARNSAAING